MGEPVEPAIPGIAGRRGEHQRQLGRVPRFAKSLLQRDQQLIGRADADESRMCRPYRDP
jgi:hypothetical protein